ASPHAHRSRRFLSGKGQADDIVRESWCAGTVSFSSMREGLVSDPEEGIDQVVHEILRHGDQIDIDIRPRSDAAIIRYAFRIDGAANNVKVPRGIARRHSIIGNIGDLALQ